MCFLNRIWWITMTLTPREFQDGSDMILNLIQTEIFEQLSDQPLPGIRGDRAKIMEEKLEKLELPVLEDWGWENVPAR